MKYQGFAFGEMARVLRLRNRTASMTIGRALARMRRRYEYAHRAEPLGAREAPPGTPRAELLEFVQRCGWNVSRAAAESGVSKTTLYNRLRRLGIKREPWIGLMDRGTVEHTA